MEQKVETKVSFNPSKVQFEEIQNWLMNEDESTGDGFYCNWNVIESHFNKKKLATISAGNKTIGFITWSQHTKFVAKIEIAEIKPSHRNMGYCKVLISKLIRKLITKNIFILQLQCAPETSEPIWRRLQFVDFPANHYTSNRGNKMLYRIIVPHIKAQKRATTAEFIELWNNVPNCTKGQMPSWKWDLSFKNGESELEKPLIHPCQVDWRIRFLQGDKTRYDDKIKRLGENKIYFDGFLVLNNSSI